ncbi:serine kinase [Chitinophaga pinensis]|uniref:Serine kinase n=1 Tax=Chitinophaga pinensis TaxID=79329 RepID=A0A5C6LPE5_9BACT|nr:serine kinase [Chitinophaga pinensis]TWV93291.1 serine kinase [Chitinophaga pinensis]
MPATSQHTDVTITIDAIPAIRVEHTCCTGRITYEMNDRELVFTVGDLAAYYVADGNRIIICPLTTDLEDRVLRLFVLAGAMAGILQQRKQVTLHAAGIVIEDGLTLISGNSGAGKSTTLAGLQERAYRIFTDDVTVLKQLPDDDYVRGIASYPMLKLWEQSLQTLQWEDRSFPVMPGMNKYGIFFHQHFDTQHYPIRRIILLSAGEVNEIQHEQLTGSKAFTQIVQHVYKEVLFRQPAARALCFDTISAMIRHSETHLIRRPSQCDPEHLLNTVTSLL